MGIELQKAAGAILFALILIVGLNQIVDMLFPPQPSAPQTAAPAATKSGQPAASPPAAEAEKPLSERLAAASADKGKTVAAKCQACHTLNEGGGTKIGPNLYGVVGRPKGSVAGFSYSEALKGLGGNWSYDDLDKFLTKPSAIAPGTKMTFPGLPSGGDRADVIAFLRSISPAAPALP